MWISPLLLSTAMSMPNILPQGTLAQDPDLGAIELGVVLSSVLYGQCLIQTYNYYMASFKNDRFHLKFLVSPTPFHHFT